MINNRDVVYARIVLAMLVTIPIVILTMVNLKYSKELDEIRSSGLNAVAFVEKKICSNHGSIEYKYSVETDTYSGVGSLCVQSLCEDVKIGDPVRVYYSKDNPQLSRCGDLEHLKGVNRQRYYFIALIYIALLFGIFSLTGSRIKG